MYDYEHYNGREMAADDEFRMFAGDDFMGVEKAGPIAGSDNKEQVYFNHLITWYAIGPISVVGVILNCLVFWTWNSKSGFQTIVFLFKTLAIFDSLYITFFNIWWYCPRNSWAEFVIRGFAFGTQYMLVNTTLMLTICRVMFVYYPDYSRRYSTRRHILAAVGLMVGICASVKIVERIVTFFFPGDIVDLVVNVMAAQAMMTLPLILQTVLAVNLVWILHSVHKIKPDVSSTGQLRSLDLVRLTETLQLSNARRLSYAVVCIATMSFIAYPIGLVAVAYYKLSPSASASANKTIVFGSVNLLHVINSSINFFFYLAFVRRFRSLLMEKLITLYTGSYQPVADYTLSETIFYAEGKDNIIHHDGDRRRSSFMSSTTFAVIARPEKEDQQAEGSDRKGSDQKESNSPPGTSVDLKLKPEVVVSVPAPPKPGPRPHNESFALSQYPPRLDDDAMFDINP